MNIVHYHAKAFYCFVLCFRSNNESENVLKRTKQCVIFSFKLTFQIFTIYHLQYFIAGNISEIVEMNDIEIDIEYFLFIFIVFY